MGLFDKKYCNICGEKIGLLGNRKLDDGNCCKDCARKLSPWFTERRHSTVEEIKEQLAYREQNQLTLNGFSVSRVIGDNYKMYIEEVNGIPSRFFVTDEKDYLEKNPDVVSFSDVVSCIPDVKVRDEEKKRRTDSGEMVSYHPPRFEHHYDFYVEIDVRNNPYFDKMRFKLNPTTVTLETVGTMNGAFTGLIGNGFGPQMMGSTLDHRRYQEYQSMCEKICQAVEEGKRGASVMAAMNEMAAQNRAAVPTVPAVPTTPPAAPVSSGPKFCPNCGSPASGGKFCQNCGGSLTI